MPLTPGEEAGHGPELHRERRALVVVDVVESVRLMQQHEDDFIDRWRRFVNEVRTEVLPPRGGRLVKSLGDGMLLEFAEVRDAVAAAEDMQRRVPAYSAHGSETAAIFVRIGTHVADVVIDELDIYGSGVNLTARLATLAQPGETVVSVDARDELVAGLDGHLVDMGLCYLKHFEHPLRAFKVAAAGEALTRARPTPAAPAASAGGIQPTIAFVLSALALASPTRDISHAMVDDLAHAAGRCALWRVISRLSCTGLDARPETAFCVATTLHADYVVIVGAAANGHAARLSIALHELRSDELIWSGAYDVSQATALAPRGELARRVIADIAAVVLRSSVEVNHEARLHSLPAYALLLQSINLTHRLSQGSAARAGQMLEHLIERHPRSADPRAWLAKWHFMRVIQGWTHDPQHDTSIALALLRGATDADPDHTLSLAMAGHLSTVIDRDLQRAEALLRRAVALGANEPLAWLFLGNVMAARGEAAQAVSMISTATRLSPSDPLRYFFDSFLAYAHIAAERFDLAEQVAARSVAANALHLPGLLFLVLAQSLAGRSTEARANAATYLQLRPTASVARFTDHHPAADASLAQRHGAALRSAGLPP